MGGLFFFFLKAQCACCCCVGLYPRSASIALHQEQQKGLEINGDGV